MFNNFDLSDDEVLKIIEDYKPLIISKSIIKGKFSEDMYQEIIIGIFEKLTQNRKK